MLKMIKEATHRIKGAKEELESSITTSTGVDESKSMRSLNLLSQSLALLDVSSESTSTSVVKTCVSSLKSLTLDLEEQLRKQKDSISGSTFASASGSSRATIDSSFIESTRSEVKPQGDAEAKAKVENAKLECSGKEKFYASSLSGEMDQQEKLNAVDNAYSDNGHESDRGDDSDARKLHSGSNVSCAFEDDYVFDNNDGGYKELFTAPTKATLNATDVASVFDDDDANAPPASLDRVGSTAASRRGSPTGKAFFVDIIGNESAKRSLMENVVLQFKLPIYIKELLFKGLRQQGSNVLLYGPPGVGKRSCV